MGGSAALGAVCRQIKLARSGDLHGAIEDAWLSMQIYLWLHGYPVQRRLPDSISRAPSNFRDREIRRRLPLHQSHADPEESEPREGRAITSGQNMGGGPPWGFRKWRLRWRRNAPSTA
jgi:hypothetical protein